MASAAVWRPPSLRESSPARVHIFPTLLYRCPGVGFGLLSGPMRQEGPRGGRTVTASHEFVPIRGHSALVPPLARDGDVRGREDQRRRQRDVYWRCAVVRQDPRILKKLGGAGHLRPWRIRVFPSGDSGSRSPRSSSTASRIPLGCACLRSRLSSGAFGSLSAYSLPQRTDRRHPLGLGRYAREPIERQWASVHYECRAGHNSVHSAGS